MGETQIRFVKMIASDLNSFLKLEKQSARSRGEVSPQQTKRNDWFEFPFGFCYSDTLFIFAEQDGQVVGCLYGFIVTLPTAYDAKKVGFLDLLIVDETIPDQGISEALRDFFYDWLRKQGVNHCKLTAEDHAPSMKELCEQWGFETEETHLRKDISQEKEKVHY